MFSREHFSSTAQVYCCNESAVLKSNHNWSDYKDECQISDFITATYPVFLGLWQCLSVKPHYFKGWWPSILCYFFIPSKLCKLALLTHLGSASILIVKTWKMNATADFILTMWRPHQTFKPYSANAARQSSKGAAESMHTGTTGYS